MHCGSFELKSSRVERGSSLSELGSLDANGNSRLAAPNARAAQSNSLIPVPLYWFQLVFMTAVLSHTASTFFGFLRSTYEYLTYASLYACILSCSRKLQLWRSRDRRALFRAPTLASVRLISVYEDFSAHFHIWEQATTQEASYFPAKARVQNGSPVRHSKI